MTHDEPTQTEASADRPAVRPAEALSIRGLGLRQYLTGWSQSPKLALLLGTYLFFMPGFLTFFFIARFVQAPTQGTSVGALALTGGLALLYLALLTGPAVSLMVRGIADLRARPRVVGGRVLAVRHQPHRSSQAHYIQIEQPNGTRERLRIDPAMHNVACQPGAHVVLSVSPRLRYVSKVWSETAEPPVLV